MNVPSSPQSLQDGITIQVRSQPPAPAGTTPHTKSDFVIPPLSPVFRTNDLDTHSSRRRRQRDKWAEDNQNTMATHAQYYDGQTYDNENFVGVSHEGLPNGADVLKHGNSMSHYTVTTRGLVTVMCPYHDIQDVPLLSYMKVAPTDTKFKGIDTNQGFTLKQCTLAERHTLAIGILVSKPDEINCANEARLLLI